VWHSPTDRAPSLPVQTVETTVLLDLNGTNRSVENLVIA
jgi:hypothetical protein